MHNSRKVLEKYYLGTATHLLSTTISFLNPAALQSMRWAMIVSEVMDKIQVICHGIPDMRPLQEGDICNVDVTVYHR